jgi:hypothetical protein
MKMLAVERPAWRWLATPLGVSAAIGAFSAALIVAMWGAVIVQMNSEHDEIISSAIHQNSNLAMAFEEHTHRTLKGIDAATLFVVHEFAEFGTKMDLSSYIAEGTHRRHAVYERNDRRRERESGAEQPRRQRTERG